MSAFDSYKNNNCCESVTSVVIKLATNDNNNSTNSYEQFVVFLNGLGRMFYIIKPSETTFKQPEDVPKFYQNAWPYFLMFMIIENVLLFIERKPTFRLNDSLTSLSHGLIQESGRLVFRSAESFTYLYLYNHYRLVDLPWDGPITWYLAAIGVDFCYYWVHRACHEIHILWAQHQVHHSSEEFNMAVGLRQSLVQGWCGFAFYLPLALFLPPSHFITHQQFNLLYQFWIHTKTIKTLGPLEYVFNTPQHHRVHHGSNIYCLDKNYGGVLIVWDRIFGTFAGERENEEIIYGLVFNQPSFNVFHLQTFYTVYVFEKFQQMQNWKDRFAAIFYGPSWQPGKPRLGLEEDKIKVTAREKYDVKLPFWCNLYLLVHFCVVIYGFQELASRYMGMNPLSVLCFVIYIIGSLTTIGLLFDNKPNACVFELFRCILMVTALQRLQFTAINESILLSLEVFFLSSSLFWLLQSFKVLQIGVKSKII